MSYVFHFHCGSNENSPAASVQSSNSARPPALTARPWMAESPPAPPPPRPRCQFFSPFQDITFKAKSDHRSRSRSRSVRRRHRARPSHREPPSVEIPPGDFSEAHIPQQAWLRQPAQPRVLQPPASPFFPPLPKQPPPLPVPQVGPPGDFGFLGYWPAPPLFHPPPLLPAPPVQQQPVHQFPARHVYQWHPPARNPAVPPAGVPTPAAQPFLQPPCPSRGVRNPQQPVTPPKKGATSGREATGQLIRKDSRFDLAAFTSQKLSQTNKSAAQAGELTAAENQLFKDVMQASALELEDQIAGRDPRDTFVVEEPLTLFLDYCFLIYQTKALRSSDAWLLYTRSQSQCGTGRKQAARMWVREWQLCTNTDIRQILDFLLSRFPEGLPPNSVDSQTLRKFCQMLWSSKCPIFDTFRAEASTFSSPAAESSVLVFPVAGFPGPPPSPDQWYQWAHGTDSAGAIGILSSGRILPTAKQTLHLKPPQSSWSFFCKVLTTPDWEEARNEFVSNMHWSTKNSCGVVFSGRVGGAAHKAQGANTVLENALGRFHPVVHSPSKTDKRWCVRTTAARIDVIYIVSSMHSLDFPFEPSLASKKSNKPLDDPIGLPLAIQDAGIDDSWGKWLPQGSSEASQQVPPAANSAMVAEIPATDEEPDLMASFHSFQES
ncbi:unnamed protein product [Symbiodinium natans]|uniref:Uncharacterized protein n=1 Tax=Symbiodinium natans TaxID=878477 RepID=A0A812N2X1_9DINO|nr:unnamed protein product [Symbiodinium natans]